MMLGAVVVVVAAVVISFFSRMTYIKEIISSVICGFNLLFYFQFRDLLYIVVSVVIMGMNMFIVQIEKKKKK